MTFDCWVTLWQRPEVPIQKPSRALQKDLAETELAITLQLLEPVVRDTANHTGAIMIIELRPEFHRFHDTPKVPTVYFRIEASTEVIAETLNLIGQTEDRPRVGGTGVKSD